LNLDFGAVRIEGGVNVIRAGFLGTGQQVHLAVVAIVRARLELKIVGGGPAAVDRAGNVPVRAAFRPRGNLPTMRISRVRN